MGESNHKSTESRAWFVVDGSSEEEFFSPAAAPVTGDLEAVQEAPDAAARVPEEAPSDPASNADGVTAEQAPTPVQVIPPEPVAEAVEELPTKPVSQQVSEPPPIDLPLVSVALSEETPSPPEMMAPPRPEPPEIPSEHSQAAAPVGFIQSEILRLGGTAPTQAYDRAGFLVVVQTPQRVRLGQIISLRDARNAIGRKTRLGGLADDPDAAETHAVITFETGRDEDGFFLYTSASAPVTLNGRMTGSRTLLRNGHRIVIGKTELVFFEALYAGGAK